MPVVEARHLSFSYEQEEVLKNLTFSIEDKEFLAVIGPNGGGKTTFLKLLMGLLRPTSGSLFVLGKSPKEARSSLAYVPQTLHVDRAFPISVFELVLGGLIHHLSFLGRFSSQDRERACEAMDKMGLTSLKDRPFGSLSGGQAQRALIARALVCQPKILLLDEPTASVDAQAEAKILQILQTLSEEATILMVTHNLKAIMHSVDRVFCLQRELSIFRPEEVCGHFAIGVYHK